MGASQNCVYFLLADFSNKRYATVANVRPTNRCVLFRFIIIRYVCSRNNIVLFQSQRTGSAKLNQQAAHPPARESIATVPGELFSF